MTIKDLIDTLNNMIRFEGADENDRVFIQSPGPNIVGESWTVLNHARIGPPDNFNTEARTIRLFSN